MFPQTGKITYIDPSFNPQTGTFQLRTTFANPKGALRPNQYVRARLKGALRPNAVLVPQSAVQQGGKGHFVWVIDKDGKAENRPVTPGDWYGDQWFINAGLQAGEQVVVGGALRLRAGAPVKATPYEAKAPAEPQVAKPPDEKPAKPRREKPRKPRNRPRPRRNNRGTDACSPSSSSNGRSSRRSFRS